MVRKTDKQSFAENISFRLPSSAEAAPDLDTKVTKDATQTANKPHHSGHRERLRQRFLDSNGQALSDYEYLELLLFKSIPRADTKPLAKALLARFGSLAAVFTAEPKLLQEVKGCGPTVAIDLNITGKLIERSLRSQLMHRNIFSSWDKVIAYCKAAMAHESKEQFRILFLDKKNALIADEIQQRGTVDHTPVYPREVLKRALELSASALILVHNHPTGDPSPSREDVAMTQKLKEAAEILNITIHDHIIIGRAGHASFKALDLL